MMSRRKLHDVAPIAVVLGFTVAVRSMCLVFWPDAFAADPDGYRAVAENLVRHGTFGTGAAPTAYRPPLYPLVLAPCVMTGSASRVAIGLAHLAIGVATVWLTYRFGRRLGLERWALLAALLVACDPILLAQSALVMTETLATFLAVATLYATVRTAQSGRIHDAIAAGVSAGLAVLCRPTFLPWAIALVGALSFVSAARWRGARIGLAFASATALALLPWAVRNQLQFGRPIVTTTHGGYTLLLANNPYFYEYLRGAPWGAVWDSQALDRHWAAKMPRGGPDAELRADQLAYAEAIQNIRNEPGMFCYACFVRLGRLFALVPHRVSPDESPLRRLLRYTVALWYAVELMLFGYGCVLAVRGGVREDTKFGWLVFPSLMACFAAVHSVYWSDMRMRAPLMPALAVMAVVGLVGLVNSGIRRKLFMPN